MVADRTMVAVVDMAAIDVRAVVATDTGMVAAVALVAAATEVAVAALVDPRLALQRARKE